MGREHSSGQQFDVGDRIRGYEILKVFDPGGFAFASKAKAPNGRSVFFKKYKRPGGSSPWFGGFVDYQGELKRRIQKLDAAKRMCYEFIEFFELSLAGAAVPMRCFYQVFEWIEGGSDLRALLDQAHVSSDPVVWNRNVLFAKMLASGINAIHMAGVIHTDLKPENFYLIPDPSLSAKYKLRVIDMDFSLLEDRKAPWSGFEGGVGTRGYMSPEHLNGTVPGKQSDVFTCGLILSELLCGRHPAAGKTGDDEQYTDAVKSGTLNPIEINQPIEKVVDLRFLNAVLNGCLRPEPARRPTIAHVLKALNGSLDSWDGMKPIQPSRGSTSPTLVPPPGAHSPVPPSAPPRSLSPPSHPPPAPAPPAPAAPHASGRRVELVGSGGRLVVSIPGVFGRANFRTWGNEFERFMNNEQFRLFKSAAGDWMMEHCASATNSTNVDNTALAGPVPVRNGMKLNLGKTGKCSIEVNMI